MCLRSRVMLLFVALVFTLPLIVLPTTAVEAGPAARQITITITEVQFNRFLRTVGKPRYVKSLEADIIDGGFIIKFIPIVPSDLEERHHFGVLIRDGKVVTEPGVVDFPGVGAIGFEELKQAFPKYAPILERNAQVIGRFVLRQVTSRAGTRYKAESVVTGNDKIVIVVNR